MKKSSLLGAVCAGIFSLGYFSTAHATSIYFEDFNGYTSTDPGIQDSTGLGVARSGTLSGWSAVGAGAIHAVDRDGAGDWALQLYNGYNTSGTQNILTSITNILANDLAETYFVTFDLGPTIYEHFSQGTSSSDGVKVEILRSNSTVLASYTALPGDWTGVQTFAAEGFQYTGDGSGAVNIRINSLLVGNNLLSGAIDNLGISTSAVPVPAAVWLFGSGLIGLIGVAKRKKA